MLCQKMERGNPSSGTLLSSLRRVSPPVSTSKGKGVFFLPHRSRVLTTTRSDAEVGIRYIHYFGQTATHPMSIFSLVLQLLAFPCGTIAV